MYTIEVIVSCSPSFRFVLFTVLCCTVLYSTALYCTGLYCAVRLLHSSQQALCVDTGTPQSNSSIPSLVSLSHNKLPQTSNQLYNNVNHHVTFCYDYFYLGFLPIPSFTEFLDALPSSMVRTRDAKFKEQNVSSTL